MAQQKKSATRNTASAKARPKLVSVVSKNLKARPRLRKAVFAVALSLPILLLMMPVIISHNRMGSSDWDIFFAYHEAIRRVVLIYHQFPWWNPWISGGVPLFANPQNGLLSIETPFIMVFGTIWGMKLAAVVYMIAGFWGMYWLLRQLQTALTPRVLLSYIWVLSTFVTFHFWPGHYTFLLYLLTPWLFFFAMKLREGWWWTAAFGLAVGFFMNTNLHYITVQALLILFCWLIGQLIVEEDKKRLLKRMLAGGALALILIAPKLYFANQYVSQFAVPGSGLIQQTLSLSQGAEAFLLPLHSDPVRPFVGVVGWWEVSAYAGITTIALFFMAAFKFGSGYRKDRKINLGLVFLAAALLTFIIGLGPFARFSPYNLLRHLPIFESMQVPSRWFGWTILFILLTISRLKNWGRVPIILLSLAVAELTFINLKAMHTVFPYPVPPAVAQGSFQQYESFGQMTGYGIGKAIGSDMYQSTISNYGEINGYEPLVNRAMLGKKAAACGINLGCNLVSSNAEVTYWSPNVIKIKRLADGPISVNVNPGSYWLVNGHRAFPDYKVAEPGKKFIINPRATDIELRIDPL